ncbi:zinc ribbon domain-containing protein [Methanobacterium spitsbergense]|uniref:Transposase n=1 Tax=Methanobacterium spitsbergense TaxID=2874285 RepID=A0A8T5UNV9_9EURY|nr:zinc ribbon domain-containing protein [Methanobacterium spitsbergense]MBZ2165488.1 transposase [Methanobacterium spitsbergense]
MLTQKIHIFPDKEQEEVLWFLSEYCRLLYNFALSDRKTAWKNNKETKEVGVDYRGFASKICSNCGYHNSNLKLPHCMWICPNCESIHDRNVNAAVNIRDFAL